MLKAKDAVDWVTAIAEEPAARQRNGVARVANARKAMRGVLRGRPLGERERNDVGWTLALAEREAGRFGPRGKCAMRTTMRAIDGIDQACSSARNEAAVRIGPLKIRPDWGTLGALAKVAERIGERAAITALQLKLAQLGIPPTILRDVEKDLNREGLSLGAMAKPAPNPGTLGALTLDTLAGQWLASKVL